MPTGQLVDSAAPVAELLRPGARQADAAGDGRFDLRQHAGRRLQHHARRGRGPRGRVRRRDQERLLLRGVRRLLHRPGAAASWSAANRRPPCTPPPAEVGQGLVTMHAADRPDRAGRRAGDGAADGHLDRQRRLDVGVPADLRHRRRGAGGLRGGAGAAAFAGSTPKVRVRRRQAGVAADGQVLADLVDVLGDDGDRARRVEWRHRPTTALDPETGQGNAHVQYAFAAHRAVVDVDTELGLVKVVALDCAQDVGKALNPQAVLGQIHGGTAQGLGLAVMEEIQIADGKMRNPSFTDYLIPTILDMPPMSDRRPGAAPTRTRRTACAGWASRRRSRRPRRSSPRSGPRPGSRSPASRCARSTSRGLRVISASSSGWRRRCSPRVRAECR